MREIAQLLVWMEILTPSPQFHCSQYTALTESPLFMVSHSPVSKTIQCTRTIQCNEFTLCTRLSAKCLQKLLRTVSVFKQLIIQQASERLQKKSLYNTRKFMLVSKEYVKNFPRKGQSILDALLFYFYTFSLGNYIHDSTSIIVNMVIDSRSVYPVQISPSVFVNLQ